MRASNRRAVSILNFFDLTRLGLESNSSLSIQ